MRSSAALSQDPSLPRRLALVEDDLRTQRTMSLLLEDEGWIVECFTDAALALAAIRAGDFQALVTDHVLPGMQGLDLVRVLRQERPGLYCVVVSGYDAPSDARAQGVPWLLKPVDFDSLLRVLDAG
jgi:CheY-like chemotaxis protein